MDVTVTVFIGLAVKGVPMDYDAASFIQDVKDSLALVGATVHFCGRGTGYSEEWGEEPAYTFVASVTAVELARLRHYLSIDAWCNEQDAIGLTVGAFELVETL